MIGHEPCGSPTSNLKARQIDAFSERTGWAINKSGWRADIKKPIAGRLSGSLGKIHLRDLTVRTARSTFKMNVRCPHPVGYLPDSPPGLICSEPVRHPPLIGCNFGEAVEVRIQRCLIALFIGMRVSARSSVGLPDQGFNGPRTGVARKIDVLCLCDLGVFRPARIHSLAFGSWRGLHPLAQGLTWQWKVGTENLLWCPHYVLPRYGVSQPDEHSIAAS